jgi:NAD(P)-dependent dehydrogenase (short-subunit alcohol dehydrogenase family)
VNSKVIIITGGASGIGAAFVRKLAIEGHRIVIADIANSEGFAAELRSSGYNVIGVQTDVSDEVQVQNMANIACSEFGGIDALVNNAGLFSTLTLKPFDQITRSEWMRVMEVNTLGPLLCVQAAVPSMRKRGGGRIVNIASTTAIKGVPNMLHYVASKGALIGFTRSLARELGASLITVNAIAPGFTLSEGILKNEIHNIIGDAARRTGRSIQRDQVPEDLVGIVSFLIGDGAAFITGQTLAVDGGSVFL